MIKNLLKIHFSSIFQVLRTCTFYIEGLYSSEKYLYHYQNFQFNDIMVEPSSEINIFLMFEV